MLVAPSTRVAMPLMRDGCAGSVCLPPPTSFPKTRCQLPANFRLPGVCAFPAPFPPPGTGAFGARVSMFQPEPQTHVGLSASVSGWLPHLIQLLLTIITQARVCQEYHFYLVSSVEQQIKKAAIEETNLL